MLKIQRYLLFPFVTFCLFAWIPVARQIRVRFFGPNPNQNFESKDRFFFFQQILKRISNPANTLPESTRRINSNLDFFVFEIQAFHWERIRKESSCSQQYSAEYLASLDLVESETDTIRLHFSKGNNVGIAT